MAAKAASNPRFRRPGRDATRRTAFAVLIGFAAICPDAWANAPQVANAPPGFETIFDNTIVSTYADGRSARLWIERDGTYRGEGRHGDLSSGRWKIKDERLCFKQAKPVPAPFSYCTAMVEGGPGTTWKTKSVFGEPLSVQIVAGR